nr:integrase, catalytic region, zinc finger, CCHC-type, peptidase aspartic, catalytic [Tanacetum cinerariifolium]
MPNNSHEKKHEVEDHHRSVKLTKNKTSVTACNDSLNAKTLNVKSVSAMCDKCVLHDKNDMCVLKSVAKPLKETIASESNKKSRNFNRKLYERISKTCSWWYPKFTPSGYKWKPKSEKENVNLNLVKIVLFIADSGCSKHMTGNLKLLINFVEKFLGTVKFGNDQIAPILEYGDLVQGALKSNLMGDRVMRNSSQGKKQEVEDQHRSVKLSKNKMSITTCNDSLNAKTLNVKSVFAMFDKCVLIDKHDMCVLKSVAKSLKEIVASKSNKKPRNLTKKLYKRLVEIVLFIIDSMCSKDMTGNLKLLINFVEKFLGTVKFRNDQIAPILGYGDLVQGAVTIKRVYYVEGLNHNLFSIGQFCDADLEVALRKSTCYIRDLKGNDLLTHSRGTDLYSITLQDTNCPNLIFLMAKVLSSQAWL